MTAVEHLFARATSCGWRIELNGDGPTLRPQAPDTPLPPKLLADLKANRAAVVEYLNKQREEFTEQQCAVCRATWYEPPTAELAATLCDRGGSKPHKDMNGIKQPGTARCPWKAP